MLEETAAVHGQKPALKQPSGGGKYRTYTWAEVRDHVQWTAVGLSTIGVEVGDIIALQSETRAEFYFADLGVMAAGAIAAALYTSLPYAEQAHALRFCEARVALVENPKAMHGLQAALAAIPGSAPPIQWVLLTGTAEGAISLDQLMEKGQRQLAADPEAFERIRARFDDQALAVLYMTSGATGEPKMGLVTHAALVINIDMTPAVLPLTPDDCTVAFLPSAHIAQRVVAEGFGRRHRQGIHGMVAARVVRGQRQAAVDLGGAQRDRVAGKHLVIEGIGQRLIAGEPGDGDRGGMRAAR